MIEILLRIIAAITLVATSTSCSFFELSSENESLDQVDPRIYSADTIRSIKRISQEELENVLSRNVQVKFVCTIGGNPHQVPGVEEIDLNVGLSAFKAAKDAYIVTVCDCPNEHGAALLASYMLSKGYSNVYPLTGGYKALISAKKS